MIQQLEELKERIIAGKIKPGDVDTVNNAVEYIQDLELRISLMPQDALIETKEEMLPASIIIENATINIQK